MEVRYDNWMRQKVKEAPGVPESSKWRKHFPDQPLHMGTSLVTHVDSLRPAYVQFSSSMFMANIN